MFTAFGGILWFIQLEKKGAMEDVASVTEKGRNKVFGS